MSTSSSSSHSDHEWAYVQISDSPYDTSHVYIVETQNVTTQAVPSLPRLAQPTNWTFSQIFTLIMATTCILASTCSMPVVEACGPGRGGVRRRGARKLTPLVYKQHMPNYGERSLAAAGRALGLIDRHVEAFRHFELSVNPDVVFKDDERTGADRIMTPRCQERLNTLAVAVANQWPGIRVRVTEAWDEDLHHAPTSLHYEGRALDLTTSDRDRTKLGLLARLAVESGFDWVYYESRSHIHVSCKSESNDLDDGGCFHGESTVLTADGSRRKVSELRINDVVQTSFDSEPKFEPIIEFLDKAAVNETMTDFVTLTTSSGHTLRLTPTHLVFYSDSPFVSVDSVIENGQTMLAGYVRSYKHYIVVQGQTEGPYLSHVTRVSFGRSKAGYAAPLTASGRIVVDNVLASCYAYINSQDVAHAAVAPLRWIAQLYSGDETAIEPRSGVHWYARGLLSVFRQVLPILGLTTV